MYNFIAKIVLTMLQFLGSDYLHWRNSISAADLQYRVQQTMELLGGGKLKATLIRI
jgi:hypothetical protein